MRKIILAAALAVSGLAMTAEAKAGVAVVAGPRGVAVGVGPRVGAVGVAPRVGGPRVGAVGVGPRVGGPRVGGPRVGAVGVAPRVGPGLASPYYRTHGIRYGGGYYYRGRDHFHWERRVWSPVYGRYHYWDPYLRAYYFYDPIRVGFFPIF